MSGRVVLFKSPKGSAEEESVDEYQVALQEAGWEVDLVAVLTFEYVEQAPLRSLLADHSFDGLILTSTRSVQAVFEVIQDQPYTDLEHWKRKPIFVVGPKSAQKVRDTLGWDNIQGSHCGDGENLAAMIIREQPSTARLLFPGGQLRREVLPEKLGQAGFEVCPITVYITKENPALKDLLQKVTCPDYVVFFSPSGLKSSLSTLRTMGWNLERIKFVAIGPTTGEAIENEGLTLFSVATKPTPEEVLTAMMCGSARK